MRDGRIRLSGRIVYTNRAEYNNSVERTLTIGLKVRTKVKVAQQNTVIQWCPDAAMSSVQSGRTRAYEVKYWMGDNGVFLVDRVMIWE